MNKQHPSTKKELTKKASTKKASTKKALKKQKGGDNQCYDSSDVNDNLKIPVNTQTSSSWNTYDDIDNGNRNIAVDINAGVNEYIFGRTTPDNHFMLASNLDMKNAKSMENIPMVGGKSKKIVKPSPKKIVKPSPKKIVKPSPKKIVKPSPKKIVKPSPKKSAK